MAATYNGKVVVTNAYSGQFLYRITHDDLDTAIAGGLKFGQLSLGEVTTDNFTFDDSSPITPEDTVSIDEVPPGADLFITTEIALVQLAEAIVFKREQGKSEYLATFNGQAIRQSTSSPMAITCSESVVDGYIADNTPFSEMKNGNIPLNLLQYINGAILSESNTILRESISVSLLARKDDSVGYIPLW